VDKILRKAFPVLFGIVCVKDASVASHVELYGGSNQWNIRFVRAAHDWKGMCLFRSLASCYIQLE
jgi:DNA polymerase/3'-5' exonuclease PolX